MNHTYIIAFWSLSPINSRRFCMDFFASSLKPFGDIQCLDCGNRQDRRTVQLLHQADLVVIALRQSHREICDLFCKNTLRFSNCIYLIVDYFPDREFDLANISFEFRIPLSRLACIPYHPGRRDLFPGEEPAENRTGRSILRTGHGRPGFRRELCRARRVILQALGF
ncbi:MAG: hypothetical protein LUD01_03740 [Clostridiales bacterium]|nr:hypothetical protein [Clostridiales bacterium]